MDASELQPDATSAGLSADVPREALLDALTCPISGKLFVDPVTATCGHTFSRRMLAKWMSQPGRQSSCPTCRAPLYHESPHQWPVNTTLADLCERFLNDALRDARDSEPALDFPPFDSQYRSRRRAASRGATSSGGGLLSETSVDARAAALVHTPHAVELPLFVLDPMVPGQEITLNVFEERYKRMVRRCMQHTRRFGMVAPADEHHEGATRAATTRERRRGESTDRNPKPEVFEAEAEADETRVYASSEEEEDALESSGDERERAFFSETDFSDDDDALFGRETTRVTRVHPRTRTRGFERGSSRVSARSRGVGRRVDPPAGPFAFLDHGVECVVTAFQEGIDGRVLVRCRATRHVKVLSAFEDEAGYAVARVVQVDDGFDGVSVVSNPTISSDVEGAAIENERAAIAAARAAAAAFVNLNESPVDARGAAVDPLVWQTQLMAAVDGVARRRRNDGMDVTETRVIDARDACRLRLRLERAVGAHRVWLAHVAGRRLEPGRNSNENASGGEDAENPENPERRPRWSRGGSLAAGSRSRSRDYFRRSYGGKPENLLALSGERPRADRPEALAWWLARVANPLPPLGAALELRGAALSASSVTRRFSRIYRGLVGSMRSVHGLAFEDFRGARPAAAAAVAIAWCRAAEASARLETRLLSAEASRDPIAGRRTKHSKKAIDGFDEKNAAARRDPKRFSVLDDDAYRDAHRLRNRHRFQFLVDSALRVFVESVSRYGEMDGEDGTGDGDGDAKDPAAWPAMRATPLPGYDPRSRRVVDSHDDNDEDDRSRIRFDRLDRGRRRRHDPASTVLKAFMRSRIAFLAAKGGAPCVAWALYRHLSRFSSDETFEFLARGIGFAIDPANREFAFVRADHQTDRESSDEPHYNSYDTVRRVPFFPQDFKGYVPDDFPRPGDAARARRAVGAETFASKRAAVSLAFGGGGGGRATFTAIVARVFFVARGVSFRTLDLALTAFAWTVAGIGHLLVLVFVSAYAPLARFAGRRATDAPSNDAGFTRSRVAATGRRLSLVSFSPLEASSDARAHVDHAHVSSARPPRDGASSLHAHPERSRLASGAFALFCAAALFLVLDSENLARPRRA